MSKGGRWSGGGAEADPYELEEEETDDLDEDAPR
jgi:hypothetical protein